MRIFIRPLVAAVVLLIAGFSPAQEFRANVSGTVTDPAGAVIPAVTIELRNTATGAVVSTQTNEVGNYVAPFVPPGFYMLTATKEGFKRGVRENLELRVGDRVRLDIQLELGGVSESVMVVAEAELLETATASKGQVVDSSKVAALPLLGRNPFMLAVISTGVQYTPALASRSNRPFDNGGMDSFAINGGRQFTNEFLLDGVPNTNTETTSPSNLSFVPSPDATEEFQVQTNSYDAQYGRTGGGIISVSLKSGTNRLRGALYHYFRHDKLNANDFASNLGGVPKRAFRWAQPGVQFDGPVYLPKLYDGRNKTFFMYSWEKVKTSIPFPQTYTVPTVEQRAGDFSRTLQANLQPILVYDPATTQMVGGAYIRQPFPGNRVPTIRIDPVSLKMLDWIPAPNQPGDARGFFNLISSPNPRTDEYDQHIIRMDQVLGSNHRFFSRYVRNKRTEANSEAGFRRAASPWYDHWRVNQGGNFDLTSTISPTLVLNFRAGYIRHQFGIAQFGDGFDPAQLGFPAAIVGQLPRKFFPRVTYTDYTTFGPPRSIGSELTYSDTWSVSETVNKLVGRHSVKFGFEGRVMFNNQALPTSSFGSFSFTRGYTQRDALRAEAAAGNAFASLLLGIPASGSVPIVAEPAYSNRYYVLFLQDDWRVTNRLTLNLGLRWDYESPQSERFDRQNRGFDAAASSPLRAPGLDLRGGLLFTDSKNRLPFRRDLNNLQPRFGLAWQVRTTTVLRGGYGIAYLPTFDTGFNNGFSVETPYVSSLDGGITPSGRWSNPYPDGLTLPAGRALGLATMLGRSFSYGFPDRVIPYIQQFSIGIQQELPGRMLAEISYVGSRSKALQTSKGVNAVPAERLALGTDLLTLVPNPLAGLLPGTAFNAATITRQQLLRPFPQFDSITQARHTIGKSWFNSLQVRVEKRLSHGIHMLASYTVSKSIEAVGYLNDQDRFGDLAKVLTAVDAPHRLVVSGGWDLPWGNRLRGVARQVLGGWQMNGILIMQSGLPIGTPGGAEATGVNPKLPGNVQNRDRWFNTCTLTLTGARQNCVGDEAPAFRVQAPFTLRSLSTRFPNIRTRRPGLMDFSIFKSFPVTETMRLQFRAEAFNLFNTPWFGGPNTTLGSAAFGTVSPSQANDPRNVQLALRLMF